MFAEGSTSVGSVMLHSGETFRQILPYALGTAAVLVILYLVRAAVGRGRAAAKSSWTVWEKLIYLVMLVAVAVLAVTAFYPSLQHRELDGWLLFVHMVGAGTFVFTLPVLALAWCEPSRFDMRRFGARGHTAPGRFYWLPKLMFWILLAAGLIVSLTMLVSMLPLYGTDGLLTLLDIHRYSGLVVVIALLIHLSSVTAQRLGWR